LKLKHSLIYILALVFGRISLLRVFNPNVSLFERIILAVATFSIVILTVTWTFIFTLSLWDSVLEDLYFSFIGEVSFSNLTMAYVIASAVGLSVFVILDRKFSKKEESSE